MEREPRLLGCSAELNYENLCDNEYLMRILASEGGVSKGFSPDGDGGQSKGVHRHWQMPLNDLLEHYVRQLFGSRIYTNSFGEAIRQGHEHSYNEALASSKRTHGGLKKISLADGDTDWVTSGNMLKEIVLFGNEIHSEDKPSMSDSVRRSTRW